MMSGIRAKGNLRYWNCTHQASRKNFLWKTWVYQLEDCRHHQGQETPYNLKGLEMDVHHPSLDFEGNTLEKKVGELVNGEKHFDNQFFFLMGARGTLVDGYFILERHTSGHFY